MGIKAFPTAPYPYSKCVPVGEHTTSVHACMTIGRTFTMTLEGLGDGEALRGRVAEAVLVALMATRGMLTMLTPPLEIRNWVQ